MWEGGGWHCFGQNFLHMYEIKEQTFDSSVIVGVLALCGGVLSVVYSLYLYNRIGIYINRDILNIYPY